MDIKMGIPGCDTYGASWIELAEWVSRWVSLIVMPTWRLHPWNQPEPLAGSHPKSDTHLNIGLWSILAIGQVFKLC